MDGNSLIRTTFEARVGKLESEARKYLELSDMLTERNLPFSVTTTYLDTSRRPKKGGLLYILYTLYKAPVQAHKSNP